MYGFIYLVENNKNNKKYIGLTSRQVNIRWQEHLRKSNNSQNKLSQAIREIGKENFSYQILEEVNNEKLREREQYWINIYNSFEDGYNMSRGGENYETSLWRIDEKEKEEIINLYTNEGYSLLDLANYYGHAKSTLYNKILEWGYETHPSGIHLDKKENKVEDKRVCQINKETLEIINIYQSPSEAKKETKIDNSHIGKSCKNYNNAAGGYYWCYNKDYINFLEIKEKEKVEKIRREEKQLLKIQKSSANLCNRKTVKQIDITTNQIINQFNSLTEAANITGFHISSISRAINQKKNYQGFKWTN